MGQKESKTLKNFYAKAAAYILGESSSIKLSGGKEKIDATLHVLNASKALYHELNNPNASLPKISELLDAKRRASNEFKRITGIVWSL